MFVAFLVRETMMNEPLPSKFASDPTILLLSILCYASVRAIFAAVLMY